MEETQTPSVSSVPAVRFTADLLGMLALVALTAVAVFHPALRETPLRFVVGLPFLLFLPGYALVAVLFPERRQLPASYQRNTEVKQFERIVAQIRDGSIDGIVRVALSFGVSIALLSLFGLVLNETPWGIRLVPVMVSLSGFIVGCTILAGYRRWSLPVDERFTVPYRRWYTVVRNEFLHPKGPVDVLLNGLLVLSIIFAVAGMSYAVSVPTGGEQFTEFYLLSENDNGQLVADDYPTELVLGEPVPLVFGVNNYEQESVEYTVVVQIQRVAFDGTGVDTSVTVREVDELERFQTSLGHEETWQEPYEIQPTIAGENLRLTFLLYRGDVPDQPVMANAYREVHLWVNVTEERA